MQRRRFRVVKQSDQTYSLGDKIVAPDILLRFFGVFFILVSLCLWRAWRWQRKRSERVDFGNHLVELKTTTKETQKCLGNTWLLIDCEN